MWGSGDTQQEYGKREVFKKSFFLESPVELKTGDGGWGTVA